jgi:hypothetical protein
MFPLSNRLVQASVILMTYAKVFARKNKFGDETELLKECANKNKIC